MKMIPNPPDWLAVAWAPYSRMSDTFSKELNGKLYCIHYLRFQFPLHAPIKYILQAFRTLQVLIAEKPQAVHVQNPPFVAGLVVYFYCLLFGARYVLHYHSAAFGKEWRWALPLQKFVARKAATNIVTSKHWADIVSSWGGHAIVMTDPYLDLPEGEPFKVGPGFNLAFVSTFAPDEPLEAVLEVARQLPEINFYITGDKRKKPESFFATAPPNVTFTGFLDPDREYPGLLRAVDAVMVLTTRDHTLQLGGCETVAVGKPLITSEWPYLREVFPKGTVYVRETAENIRDGILEAQRNQEALAKEILALRQESRRDWDIQLGLLNEIVAHKNGKSLS